MIVNKAAARRILVAMQINVTTVLECLPHDEKGTRIRLKYRVRGVRKPCHTLISRAEFLKDFVETRREKGRSILSQRPDLLHYYGKGRFGCWSPSGMNYTLTCTEEGVFCDCTDFVQQMEHHGKACCCHAYAVLFKIGLGSLREYIELAQGSALTEAMAAQVITGETAAAVPA